MKVTEDATESGLNIRRYSDSHRFSHWPRIRPSFLSNSSALSSGLLLPPNCKLATPAPKLHPPPPTTHTYSKRTTKGHVFSWYLLFMVITIFPGALWQAFPWLESHHTVSSFSITGKMNRCLKLTSIYLPLVDRVISWYLNKTMLLCGHGRSGSREQQCLPQVP